MTIDGIFLGATLRDRFVAAAARDDETAAHRLAPLTDERDDVTAQRNDAWALLSTGAEWAARALRAAGVNDTDQTPVTDSETAFQRAQHLEQQLFTLSQMPGFHDREALLVDAVKRACYAAAELGPIQGGRLAAFSRGPAVVREVAPAPVDLQEVGSEMGEALHRLAELGLGDVVKDGFQALAPNS
jgi:hypothetical protein